MQIATHSGKFHADDVLAWALLCCFLPESLKLVRTRDQAVLDSADLVFDVGSTFSPSERRFDHHQNEYQGPLSSAGMVLNWLYSQHRMTESLHHRLQAQLVNYVDDVDNGRLEVSRSVPCFSGIVGAMNHGARSLEDFDHQFHKAASIATMLVEGIIQEDKDIIEAESTILEMMQDAKASGSNLIELPRYLPWSSIYFANGGMEHPAEFLLFPTMNSTWQVLAIPPEPDSFAQKRSFPKEWAGLRDEQLSAITGVPSIFCHKNRFIAVFHSREGALAAMRKFNLIH